MISAAALQDLLAIPEYLQGAMARAHIARSGDYTAFVNRLYVDLDDAINTLQANPEILKDDSEDRITFDVLIQLRRLGYVATHDQKSGGHVDLTVILGTLAWIGEAKKDQAFEEGAKQLLSRYRTASGNPAHNAGGLLFYLVKTPDAKGHVNKWKDVLTKAGTVCEDCKRNVLAFYASHKLEGFGTDFNVRTMAISLFHEPKDKSALLAAQRRQNPKTRGRPKKLDGSA